MLKPLLLTISSFICLSLVAQEWTQLNDSPFLKHHSNGFGIDGKAYIMEGTNGNDGPNNISDEWWQYNPETDSWLELGVFPGPARRIAIGDDWDGKYYYGFGNGGDGVGYLNDLWVLDPDFLTFTELPACPCEGRSHPAFVAHNDKIFMGSGSTPYGDLKDWWEYDMQTQVWTQKDDIPGDNRHHPFQFAIGDFIYVGGGHALNWAKYDMVNEVWSAINSFPDGRVAGSQFSYNGKGYLLGGDDENHNHVSDAESFLQYDPEEDEWIPLPELPLGSRWANSSFIIDSALYYFGGISDDYDDDSTMWVFDLSIYDPIDTTMVDTTMIDTTSTFIDVSSIDRFHVSPNPFHNFVQISGDFISEEPFQLRLIDSAGKEIWLKEEIYVLDKILLTDIRSSGIYFLHLKSPSLNHTFKLFKE